MRPRRLKLVTHMENGWIYCVNQNQAAAAYLSLYFFIFLSLQFSEIKIFRHTFLRKGQAYKVETWYHMDNGWMYHVYQNQAAAAYLSVYFFNFSFQFSNIKIFSSQFSEEL